VARGLTESELQFLVFLYVVFLAIPCVIAYVLGRRDARRAAVRPSRVARRAVLWSLVLAWTPMGLGHGLAVLPFPA
jgi:hypothetical protein